jgi:hypothetical protein
MMRQLRFQTHLAGCCTCCDGTGVSGDTAVPGGLCWDCRATGHPHDATRLMLWHKERRYRADLHWLTDRPFDVHLAEIHDDYAQTIAALDAALTPREAVAA